MTERGRGADAAHHAFAPQVASTEGLCQMPFLRTSVTSAALLPAGESGWDKAVNEHPRPSGSGV